MRLLLGIKRAVRRRGGLSPICIQCLQVLTLILTLLADYHCGPTLDHCSNRSVTRSYRFVSAAPVARQRTDRQTREPSAVNLI